jgi:hypothetical protein
MVSTRLASKLGRGGCCSLRRAIEVRLQTRGIEVSVRESDEMSPQDMGKEDDSSNPVRTVGGNPTGTPCNTRRPTTNQASATPPRLAYKAHILFIRKQPSKEPGKSKPIAVSHFTPGLLPPPVRHQRQPT